jgi:hypothetical protein
MRLARPSSSGSACSFSTIGSSCPLSLAACVTSAATMKHAARGDYRLGVVTLVKAPAGDFHDARVFIRQVHLVLVFHPAVSSIAGWYEAEPEPR